MIRIFTVLALLASVASPAYAVDDGGFGAKFTNAAPTALMETPDSQVAQSVQTPSADDLQNIMPAAGEETPVAADVKDVKDETKDILSTAPTTSHDTPVTEPEEEKPPEAADDKKDTKK